MWRRSCASRQQHKLSIPTLMDWFGILAVVLRVFVRLWGLGSRGVTYSLHCSSFFWSNQFYIKDHKYEPQKGTTTETIGRVQGLEFQFFCRGVSGCKKTELT